MNQVQALNVGDLLAGSGPADEKADSSTKNLSAAQMGIYFAHLLDSSGVGFNTAHYRVIRGELDTERFHAALQQVVAALDTYRSSVVMVNDQPRIFVGDGRNLAFQQLDFSSHAEPISDAISLMKAERLEPFDLEQGPLVKFALVKVSEQCYFFYHVYHHLVVDGAGVYQFERYLFESYLALIDSLSVGVSVVPSNWSGVEQAYRRSPAFEDDKNFWRQQLDAVDPQISLSYRRVPSGDGVCRESVKLDRELCDLVKAFCTRNKIAQSRLLISVAILYYARMTGQSEILIELPVSLRTTPDDAMMVDMRSNKVLMRLELHPQLSLDQFFALVRRQLKQVLRHDQYRFEDALRDLAWQKSPSTFAVNMQPSSDLPVLPGCEVELSRLHNGPVDDAVLSFYADKGSQRISVSFDGNSARYGPAEVSMHLRQAIELLRSVVSGNVAMGIKQPAIISPPERHEVLTVFNETSVPLAGGLLPELF
uniref:condensation domain-containing protein n=1 Tax=Orrella sp. TaxID=1921583 RepID=UPI0040473E21